MRIKPKSFILVASLLVLAILWGTLILHLIYDRKMEISAAETNASNLAAAFNEHVWNSVRNIDSLLLDLRSEYQRSVDQFEEHLQQMSDYEVADKLLLQVSIINRDGKLVFNSKGLPSTPIDLSDREHFRVHQSGNVDKLFISKPVIGRASQKRTIQFTRRILDKSGAFAGVIVISVNPEYFSDFYQRIDIGPKGAITLVGMDRVMRARASKLKLNQDPIGTEVPKDRPFLDPAKPAAATYRAPSAIDSVIRIGAYRRLPDYPLVVLVLLSEDDVLANFNNHAKKITVVALLFSLVIAAAAWMLRRSEQKHAEDQEELNSMHQNFIRLLDNTTDFVYFKDKESRFIFCSQPLAAITNHRHWQEMTGKHDFDVFPDETARIYHEEELPIFRDGVPLLNRIDPYFDAQGEKGWVNTNKWPVFDANGNVCGVFGISRDVTEMFLFQEQLRKSEEKFRMIIETTTDLIFQLDNDGHFSYCSQSVVHFLGQNMEAVTGKHFSNFIYPESVATASDAFNTVMSGTPVRSLELRLQHPHFTNFFIEVNATPILADNTVTGLHGIARDITARKYAEYALQKSELRYRNLFDQASDGIFIMTLHGILIEVNNAFAGMHGYSAEEMKGMSLGELDTAESASNIPDRMRRIIAGETLTFEVEHYHRDGHIFPLEVSAKLITIDDKPVVQCLHKDIAESRRVKSELLQAKIAAESANHAKSRFLANMSHEIRTPMNGLFGMMQLLEMTPLDEEQKDYVSDLKKCGKNLLSLMSDILDLSKIEAGKVDLVLADFSLYHCINDVALMQKTVAFEKHITLNLNLAKEIPHILIGDQLRIKQILLNLLGNAIKFTAEGNVTLSAQILKQYDNFVQIQIEVCDSGIGISPEFIDTIFEPFVQQDASINRKYGGTGLGLTISLRLAELMGGTISVESRPGVGSCFKVILPFSVAMETATLQAPDAITKIGWDGPSLRILYAEDDAVNIKFVVSLLNKMGFDVTVVDNGRDCLIALEQGNYDLVLMDIQMPVMNGEEALCKIREKELGTTNHQKVVALTAYSMRGDMERFIAAGFDGYLSKPLITREFVAELKRILGV